MNKLKVLIADDEQDALEVLSNIIIDNGKAEVLRLVSDATKIEKAVQTLQPDILFLDIQMPEVNGLELLKKLREYKQELHIILVTAYDKYITEAIKHNVYSYLLKPVDRLELNLILDRLYMHKISKGSQVLDKLKLPICDGYVFVFPEDVFMLQADGNYTKIYTSDNVSYTSSYNMGRLLDRLPKTNFLRINRGCVINANYLHRINKSNNTCIARVNDQDHIIEVSQSFIKAFNKKY